MIATARPSVRRPRLRPGRARLRRALARYRRAVWRCAGGYDLADLAALESATGRLLRALDARILAGPPPSL
jgi:hypothetical protein